MAPGTEGPHRGDPRVGFEARVQLKVSGLDAFVERFARNISRSGIFIETRSPLQIGKMVALRVVDTQGVAVFEASARVAWTRPPRPGSPLPCGMGLAFVTMTETSRDVIAQICGAAPELAAPAPPPPAAAPENGQAHDLGGMVALDDADLEPVDSVVDALVDELAAEVAEPMPEAPAGDASTAPTPAPPEPGDGLGALLEHAAGGDVVEPPPPKRPRSTSKPQVFAQRPELALQEATAPGEPPTAEVTPPPAPDLPVPEDDGDDLWADSHTPTPYDDAIAAAMAAVGEAGPGEAPDRTEPELALDDPGLGPPMSEPPAFGPPMSESSPPEPAPPAETAPEPLPPPPPPPVFEAEPAPAAAAPPDEAEPAASQPFEEGTQSIDLDAAGDPVTAKPAPAVPLGPPLAQPDAPSDGLTNPFEAEGNINIDVWEEHTREATNPLKVDKTADQIAGPSAAPPATPEEDTFYVHAPQAAGGVPAPQALEEMGRLLEMAKEAEGGGGLAPRDQADEAVSDIGLGIDLGSSNATVAYVQNDKPVRVRDPKSTDPTLSSIVQIAGTEVRVGTATEAQLQELPHATVEGFKRLIGRKFFSRTVQVAKAEASFDIVSDEAGDAAVRIDGQVYPMTWFATELLREMRMRSNAQTQENVRKTVLAVPPYYNSYQRHALVQAASLAGLHVQRVVNEPTAVAIAYALAARVKKQTVLVYGLGSGGFHASVIRIENGGFHVLSCIDDVTISGRDFDQDIAGWMAEQALGNTEISSDNRARLELVARAAREELSSKRKAKVSVTLPADEGAADSSARTLQFEITRKQLGQLMEERIDRTIELCNQILREAGVDPKKLDQVLLHGRVTLSPILQDRIKKSLSKKIRKPDATPDAVAVGAARLAERCVRGEKMEITEAASQAVGVAIPGGRFKAAIERNASLPAHEQFLLGTSTDNQSFVSLDVYQGLSDRIEGNEYIGTLEVSGIEPRPKGEVQFSFEFKMTDEGILWVRATDNIHNNTRPVPMVVKEKPASRSEKALVVRERHRGKVLGNIFKK